MQVARYLGYPNHRPSTLPCTESALLLLPDAVLERILLATGRKGELRHVCKAFSLAISKSATVLTVPREVWRNHENFLRVLSTFPNSRRLNLTVSHGKNIQLSTGDLEHARLEEDDDAVLLARAFDALAALRHPLTSLAVVGLPRPLRLPSTSTLSYLSSCGLSELELRDVSIQRAASDGAANLLRSAPGQLPGMVSLADSIRDRGAAMVRFACCLPSLRRLSLCNAAFSDADVAALAALTQLEELTIDGAMECGGGGDRNASAAGAPYPNLLAPLRWLRRLRLPMAIPTTLPYNGASHPADLLDSDDDEPDDLDLLPYCNDADEREGAANEPAGGRCFSSGGSFLPPHLKELDIPLCALNGPVFRTACEAYGRLAAAAAAQRASASSSSSLAGAAAAEGGCSTQQCGACCGSDSGGDDRGLRALRVICAPGYSQGLGSFLKAERDFAALSRLSPSLESLHLSLELGGGGGGALRLRGERLRNCLRHLRGLGRLQELRIQETAMPLCFSVRKTQRGSCLGSGGSPTDLLLTGLLYDAPSRDGFDGHYGHYGGNGYENGAYMARPGPSSGTSSGSLIAPDPNDQQQRPHWRLARRGSGPELGQLPPLPRLGDLRPAAAAAAAVAAARPLDVYSAWCAATATCPGTPPQPPLPLQSWGCGLDHRVASDSGLGYAPATTAGASTPSPLPLPCSFLPYYSPVSTSSSSFASRCVDANTVLAHWPEMRTMVVCGRCVWVARRSGGGGYDNGGGDRTYS